MTRRKKEERQDIYARGGKRKGLRGMYTKEKPDSARSMKKGQNRLPEKKRREMT